MPSRPSASSQKRALSHQTIVFSGRLLTLDRREAGELALGEGALVSDEVGPDTTMVVAGADGGSKLRKAVHLNTETPDRIRILSEDDFCGMVGVPTPSALRQQYHARRDLLERYTHLRSDHLAYLQKWGLIRPVYRTHAETFYTFADVGVLKQADAELAIGATFRATLKTLLAGQSGQLAFDFRIDAQPAKVVRLKPKETPSHSPLLDPAPRRDDASAEQYFLAASILDDGEEGNQEEAAFAYRRALEIDPYLVPALINLANIHYARNEMAEAHSLYERATAIDPDVFEAHYNLGNIYHDLGRYNEAQSCYRSALRLNPAYADAHFYLAVTLEKSGHSPEARPHWRAYQQLAPNGEWVELAKEFSE